MTPSPAVTVTVIVFEPVDRFTWCPSLELSSSVGEITTVAWVLVAPVVTVVEATSLSTESV